MIEEENNNEKNASWKAPEGIQENKLEGREKITIRVAVESVPSGKPSKPNEDRAFGLESAYAFGVFDGMGGHAGGERASSMAQEIIRKKMEEMVEIERTDALLTKRTIEQLMKEAIESADIEIAAAKDDKNPEMGTTVVVLKIVPGRSGERAQAFFASVGDSRIYLLREGKLQRLTVDDVYVNDELREKMVNSPADLTEKERELYPLRYAITKVVGKGDLDVEIDSLELMPGDVFLLCTDGLTDNMGPKSDEEIEKVLRASRSPVEAVKALVEKAKQGPKRDDITGMVIEYQK